MKRKRKTARANLTGRNESEQFIAIPYAMARSTAFRSLSGNALKVWIELRSRFNGRNNGDLTLSLDEAARILGIGKATAQRAFAELEDKGFLKMVQLGSWYGRRATTWAVTDRSYQGHAPTRDWNRWRPAGDAKNAPSVLRRNQSRA